ncbi:DMT family transporter [Pseudomonas sp. NPDC090202]|uniref:DMT family transporter n=1 Tax=unclassified Pseudomonas TaxID=196821 RepID=UPI0037FA3EBE
MTRQEKSITPAVDSTNPRLGILLCLLSMLVFASQDGLTKVLVRDLPITQMVTVRYWVFALFALGYASWQGGIRQAARSKAPRLQILRAVVGVGEIALFGFGLRFLGMADMHALFAVFPLMALALAGWTLGETIGVRRWIAAAIGFTGTLIILRPGFGVFQWAVVIPLLSAFAFACFNVMTRRISQVDPFATNMLYVAVFGAIAVSCVGIPAWVTPTPKQWLMLCVLSSTGILGQVLLIQALKYAPAATLQPFNYTLLVFATLVGLVVFGEFPDHWTLAGAALVIVGGLYALKARS